MNKDQGLAHIPSFPFDSGSKSISGMLANVVALLRCKTKMWENGHLVLIDVPVNPREAQKLLPLGLRLQESNRATFFFADYAKTAFTTSYRECALLLHVRSRLGGPGIHCAWMIVNDDTALIYGRELLAYPKKMGEISFDEQSGVITAGTTRRGVNLALAKVTIQAEEKNPAPVTAVKIYNTGGMGQLLAFNAVWLFKFVENIHAAYTAAAELQIVDSPYDPIRKIIADYANPLPARVAKVDILGWHYMLPVGLAGPRNYANTFELKFR
jgi:acetoacetate decarboxylase